jgi:glyoxylase-like metal-dependent hydrolase (beta-lactamase superfamily II)/rhodanese-related sulfurtransferase
MYIEQIYTNCLSEASYYIESENEAVIIDPIRDTAKYIELAKQRNATIKYIFETHFHADFVSGHLELSKQTNAPIVYGPNAETLFSIHKAIDGEVIKLGKISFTVLHTPGHTLESACYLLKDENNKDNAVFTGDTLFVGDVGRPDLFGSTITKEEMADMLFDSLQDKIKPLHDDVVVYPAHGPGSACGKALGKETFSTIGIQKATNYALKHTDRLDFIDEVTSGLNAPPPYFPINAGINKGVHHLLDDVMKNVKALSVAEFEALANTDTIIIDTRKADDFTEGFVPNSIFIGLDGRFAEWAGTLLPYNKNIILVSDLGKEEESIIRLTRVGLDNIKGYLQGGFEAWKSADKKIDIIINIEADELKMDLQFDADKLAVIDVRKPSEFEAGHIDIADNFSLANLTNEIEELPEYKNLYVHCAGGYRSVIAASILKQKGIHNLRNVIGGWGSITKIADMPIAVPEPKNIELN